MKRWVIATPDRRAYYSFADACAGGWTPEAERAETYESAAAAKEAASRLLEPGQYVIGTKGEKP